MPTATPWPPGMWTVRTDLVAAKLCLLIGKRFKMMELK